MNQKKKKKETDKYFRGLSFKSNRAFDITLKANLHLFAQSERQHSLDFQFIICFLPKVY